MTISIQINTTEDVTFEASLLLRPASNYSDGIDKGFRPAIGWAIVKMPNQILRSGMFSIKGESAQATSQLATKRAREVMFEDNGDCICHYLADSMLETYEREP